MTTPIVAAADADSRLKSFESSDEKRGLVSSACRIARSNSASVAPSIARCWSESVTAWGSSCRATMPAALVVEATRMPRRSAIRRCNSSMRAIAGRESTLPPRCISWVLPVSVANVGVNSALTSSRAAWAGLSSVNCWVPAVVETLPAPTANTPVTSRNATTSVPGRSVMKPSIQSIAGW